MGKTIFLIFLRGTNLRRQWYLFGSILIPCILSRLPRRMHAHCAYVAFAGTHIEPPGATLSPHGPPAPRSTARAALDRPPAPLDRPRRARSPAPDLSGGNEEPMCQVRPAGGRRRAARRPTRTASSHPGWTLPPMIPADSHRAPPAMRLRPAARADHRPADRCCCQCNTKQSPSTK